MKEMEVRNRAIAEKEIVVFRPQYLPVLALRILFNYLYFYAVVAPEE